MFSVFEAVVRMQAFALFVLFFIPPISAKTGEATKPLSEIEIRAYLDFVVIDELQASSQSPARIWTILEDHLSEHVIISVQSKHILEDELELSLSLKSKSISQVLEIVCSKVGYSWAIEEGSIVIYGGKPAPMLDADGLELDVFPVSRATVIRTRCFH